MTTPKTRKVRSSQHLVQVSTYVPSVIKLHVEEMAAKAGITPYKFLRNIIEDYIVERKGAAACTTKTNDDAELLG